MTVPFPTGGTDTALAPFDRHPASLTLLDDAIGRLQRLSEQTVDLRQGTDGRFQLAVHHWEGLAAPELQAAPTGVRRDAVEGGGALLWLGGALSYWRGQVELFNATVADLERQREEARSSRWGVPAGPEFEYERTLARQEHEHELRQRWQSAYALHVEEGSATVAAMLRDGPSADHLRLLRESGVWQQQPPQVVQLFMPQWHDRAMDRLADELGEIVDLINEPYAEASPEQLARLEEMLGQYATDEAFAYYFLDQLGAEGLLLLTGNLATLQLDWGGDDREDPYLFDPELAELVGSVQQSLGLALATATVRRGVQPPYPGAAYTPGRYELDAQWKADLVLAGERTFTIGDPESPMRYHSGVYGYQLLGVLLQHGDYDAHFLGLVGGRMIDFELAQGGSGFWRDAAAGENFRLDWTVTDGFDDTAPAGYDPIAGLMSALARNPEGALEVFTGERTDDEVSEHVAAPPDGFRFPRLDYLLTDREWPDDLPGGPGYPLFDQAPVSPGLVDLGKALEGAVALPDERAVDLVEAIVYELNVDEQAMGYDNGEEIGEGRTRGSIENDLMHPVLRESIARVAAEYIWDINRGLDAANAAAPGGRQAEFYEAHVLRLLADLGKDQQAHQIVHTAEVVFAVQNYRFYLSELDMSIEQRVIAAEQVAHQYGAVTGALDYGAITQQWREQLAADQQHNQQVDDNFAVAGFFVDKVVSKIPGPMVSDGVGLVVDDILGEIQESLRQDNSGLVVYTVGETLEESRQAAADLAMAAFYHSGVLEYLPPELINPDGSPKPMSEWTGSDFAAWQHYLDTDGSVTVRAVGNSAAASYSDGTQYANEVLNGVFAN